MGVLFYRCYIIKKKGAHIMLILAIVSFALEMIFIIATNAMPTMSEGFAWFVIVMFVLCTVASLVALIGNIRGIKSGESKGKFITGMIFSIVGLSLGLIFCIVCFGTIAALS